jgi:hypothetical protein
MGRMGNSCCKSGEEIHDESHTWRVVDDLAHDHPISVAELDAVAAFLMPLVHALLANATDKVQGKPQGSGLKQSQPADDHNTTRNAPV